jgi:hypothetical protein
MGGAKEGIETTMEVDSIVVEVATRSTQVAHDTTKVTIKTMHPSTLLTIIETEEGTKNFQSRNGTLIAPMVGQIVFW